MSQTITETFESTNGFENLLRRTGLKIKEINHLVEIQVFTSMKVLIDHIPNTKELRKTLEDINKSLGSAPENRQVFFGKVSISKILDVHYYNMKCTSNTKYNFSIGDVTLVHYTFENGTPMEGYWIRGA